MGQKTHLVRNRILFSIVIVFVYYVCHKIPLNGIDLSAYKNVGLDVGTMLTLAVSGSSQKCYVMTLGISPYITSSLIMMVVQAARSKEAKARTSPKTMRYWITAITFIVAVIQAFLYARDIVYVDDRLITKIVCGFELVAGACMAQDLLMWNQKYGVGGLAPIICINMGEGLISTLLGAKFSDIWIPMLISIVMIIIMIYMELHEKKIPLQRVSVHNIHADKNYLSIKYNPVGFMAIMFGSCFFMIPQILVGLAHIIWKDNEILSWWATNLTLNTTFGMCFYIVMLFILNICFALLFVNPWELSENLLYGGDVIENVRAGKPTRNYILKWVLILSTISGLIMCGCLALCYYLQTVGIVSSKYSSLPSTFMMLSALVCSLYLEIKAYRSFDSYKRFI